MNDMKLPDWIRRWVELAGLWALVFAWPFFNGVASGPEALTGPGADRIDVLLMIILVIGLAPSFLLALEIAARLIGGVRAADLVHAFFFGGAVGLLVWQQLGSEVSPWLLFLIEVGVVVGCGALWLRTRWGKSFLGIMSIAAPVVVIMFLFSYPIGGTVLPGEATPDVDGIEPDTPVVLMVFDELPLTSLLRQEGKLDDRTFPSFGNLASSATWYPNAFSSAQWTNDVLPTMLTGRIHTPEGEPPPRSADREPENLCTMLSRGGYEVHGYELITDYCGPKHSRAVRQVALYSQGVAEDFMPTSLETRLVGWLKTHVGNPDRRETRIEGLKGFIRGIPDEDRVLSFAHSHLPHRSWNTLPNGTTYPEPLESMEQLPEGATWPENADAEIRDVYRRHLLQVGFVDQQIGDLIDHLKQTGIWDKALVIVTSDHGAGIRAGAAYRGIADDDDAAQVVNVPLFVKYPGQTRGVIDSRLARSADVAPTIMDILGMPLPEKLDGRSLVSQPPPARWSEFEIVTSAGPLSLTRSRIHSGIKRSLEERSRTFDWPSLFAGGGDREAIGLPVTRIRGLRTVRFQPDIPSLMTPDGQLLSGAAGTGFTATITDPGFSGPTSLLLAVNGRVVGTSRAWQAKDDGPWRFTALIPPTSLEAETHLDVYVKPSRTRSSTQPED